MCIGCRRHSIARAPDGVWVMYCPKRGPDRLLYCVDWGAVLYALNDVDSPCPHDDLLRISFKDL